MLSNLKFKIFSKTNFEQNVKGEGRSDAIIIAHLFYVEEFSYNIKYLEDVQEVCKVYIVTANEKLFLIAKEYIEKNKLNNIEVIKKPNRGRDFAALFVTCSDIINKYDYIGFVHDKKSHDGDDENLGKTWEKCLFENTVASKFYVANIINEFNQNKKLGLLTSPIPPEAFLLGLRGKLWTYNFDNAKEFLKSIGIKHEINIDEDPMTIGTAFWFRRDSLKKLISKNFTYEDFPEEPMRKDGTIAHVLERIIDIIVKEEGYEVLYSLNNEYAAYYLSYVDSDLTKSIMIMRDASLLRFKNNFTSLDLTYDVLKQNNKLSSFIDYCTKFRRVYLIKDDNDNYKNLKKELENNNIEIEEEIDINNLDCNKLNQKYYGIISTLNKENQLKLKKILVDLDREGYFY